MNKLINSYYRSKLNVAERQIYDILYRKWLCNENVITFPGYWMQVDMIAKIISAIMWDYPSLFWVNYYQYSLSATFFTTKLRMEFFFNGAQLYELSQQASAWQNRIAGKLPSNARTIDKAWLIFDYLARQVTYGEQNNAYSHTIIGPMSKHNHIGVCEGIAKSYKFLCDGVGVPCIIVSGSAYFNSDYAGSHAWNMVECEGRTFHVDVTAELGFAHHFGRAGQDTFLRRDSDMINYSWDCDIVPGCN